MRRCDTVADIRASLKDARNGNRQVALVPTMGALHDGHLSLVDVARTKADLVVMSLFVNPLQFGESEDLAKYPRQLESDTRLAEDRGVDLLFCPDEIELFRKGGTDTRVVPGDMAQRLEGKIRPGHFSGVLTVVAKLINVVDPDFAVFGQKDLQQAKLINAMVHDLNMKAEVVIAPIVRDSDGLALSSRNRFLTAGERSRALGLPRAIRAVETMWRSGEESAETLSMAAGAVLQDAGVDAVDYIAVVDPHLLSPVKTVGPGSVIAIAVRVGKTRLLDNLILREEDV